LDVKTLNHPTLVTHGEMSHARAKLINDGVNKCIPRALQVSFSNLVHDAPSRESVPAFTTVFEFFCRGVE
jgi:hypothetical protein